MSSLMAMSFLCSFGPVWYHPTILSLAEEEKSRTQLGQGVVHGWTRMVCVHSSCLTVDFLEHPIHVLQVVVVQEPHRVISVILVKWHWKENAWVEFTWLKVPVNSLRIITPSTLTCKAIWHIKDLLLPWSQKDSNNSFLVANFPYSVKLNKGNELLC